VGARARRGAAHTARAAASRAARAAGAAGGGALLLSGCGASGQDSTAGGSPVWWGATVVVAAVVGTVSAVTARRSAKRPLQREVRRGGQERAALVAERGVLLRERENYLHDREQREARLHAMIGDTQALTAERDQLLAERDALVQERDELAEERDELQGSVDATFVNLAMRTLTLVERQLVLIETLEGQEADPDQLEHLFRLDHLATRMRRNSENMLLLAGLENSRRGKDTVSLLDVVRAAVSEIERYERVKIGFLPVARLSGSAADDTSHLLAELLENATSFSPPQDQVEIGAWRMDNGELMLSVTDRGIGMPAERMREINEQLAATEEPSGRRDSWFGRALTGRSMGLFVVARLARRHGVRVQLRENAQGGGVTAVIVVPREALADDGGEALSLDLDEQRRAERSVTAASAAAASAFEEERLGFGGPSPVVPAPRGSSVPADGPGGAGDRPAPALPRRVREAGQGAAQDRAAAAAPASAGAPATAAPATSAPARPHAPGAEPEEPARPHAPAGAEASPGAGSARHARPADGGTSGPAEAGQEVTEPQRPAAARDAHKDGQDGDDRGIRAKEEPVDEANLPKLPRRSPRTSGLPGTGEAPVSGLRRVSSAEDTNGTGVGTAGLQRRPATSASELRSRLGGFQSGLRRAARETAAGTGEAGPGTGTGGAAGDDAARPGQGPGAVHASGEEGKTT